MDNTSHMSGNSTYTGGHGSSPNNPNERIQTWATADDKMGQFFVTGAQTTQQRSEEAAKVFKKTNDAFQNTRRG